MAETPEERGSPPAGITRPEFPQRWQWFRDGRSRALRDPMLLSIMVKGVRETQTPMLLAAGG